MQTINGDKKMKKKKNPIKIEKKAKQAVHYLRAKKKGGGRGKGKVKGVRKLRIRKGNGSMKRGGVQISGAMQRRKAEEGQKETERDRASGENTPRTRQEEGE